MSFKIGTTIGQYEIIERIGRGGMATVYRGRHTRLNRDVAIKVLHPTLNDDDSFLRRFDREAQLVAQLEHPHIVPVYDFAEHDSQPYLVMRLVEGDTLKERMTLGTLSRNEIFRVAQAIADGLDYAHEQGVLHRDIKPSNIMLTSANGVYIADFGLARMAQAGESTLSQDMIMGTPQYISPEQAMGNKELDGRTDLYSFGIILYELVTGQAPFQSETTYSIIHMQIFDAPPLPSLVNPKISPDMEAVLLNALSKEPDGRYDTGRELVTAFRQAFETMPEDFSPTGAVVLSDYTPVGATKVHKKSELTPELTPPPSLPEITEDFVEETAVTPQKKKRSKWAIIGGIAILLFLCSTLAYGASIMRQQRENRQANLPPIVNNQAPRENIPPSAGRALFMPPVHNIRPIPDIENELIADPQDPQLKAELARAYLRENNPEEAQRIIGDIFSKIQQPHQFIETIDGLLETENYELAALVSQEGLSRFKNDAELQHRLLMALILANASPETIEEVADFLYDLSSPGAEINLDLAEAYLSFQHGEKQESLEILEDLTIEEQNPFLGSTYYLIGQVHLDAKNPKAAQEAFEQAMRHEPPPWIMIQIESKLNP